MEGAWSTNTTSWEPVTGSRISATGCASTSPTCCHYSPCSTCRVGSCSCWYSTRPRIIWLYPSQGCPHKVYSQPDRSVRSRGCSNFTTQVIQKIIKRVIPSLTQRKIRKAHWQKRSSKYHLPHCRHTWWLKEEGWGRWSCYILILSGSWWIKPNGSKTSGETSRSTACGWFIRQYGAMPLFWQNFPYHCSDDDSHTVDRNQQWHSVYIHSEHSIGYKAFRRGCVMSVR